MANSCDVWTINNTFVNTLETKLKSTVKRYENEIKSGMKQPGICTLIIIVKYYELYG